MNKIIFILRISTLSFTVFISLFSFLIQPSYSQENSPKPNFWNKIFQPARDPEPPIKPRKGGSRPGQTLCLISPDVPTKTRIIWTTKPLFIWKNGEVPKGNRVAKLEEVKKIAVGLLNSQEYFKAQIVTGKQSISYQGEPLEPGQTYKWLIFLNQESASPAIFVPFQIMETPQRNRITTELKLLERLHNHKDTDAENIALVKAKYFADKGLWSDALQQAYSVPKPSSELSQIIKDLPNQLCD
ncbi:DUF928 domain-containing protein [Calothrix sp. PCC 7507]|uniref:DUF928 domain-containing protein n=1 Tax=Calothrix sp. PCC 7507 TaxID=99598 RepID=UPI00029F1107|nr:DUF928 domain-containing protein [Calothrix sp. PCC 7507]AFY31637.1 hypothetical protein Cal7507_1163 [Calothrix sp. PCC 7507]